MVTIIRNAKVYQPEYAGVKDILILGDRIAAVGEHLRADFGGSLEVQEINGEDMAAVPGFIDSHEHILGGGGEGGFHTRTPEASLGDLVRNGITTVVGCIGTDGVGRDMAALLAKAHALENEGITTYAYTGSYQVPVPHADGQSDEGYHDAGQSDRRGERWQSLTTARPSPRLKSLRESQRTPEWRECSRERRGS